MPNAGSMRGQIWATDFTAGIAVLTFILMLFMLMWNGMAMRWNAGSRHMAMEESAFMASEALMATSGEPKSWEMLPHIDGNVSALGLVNGRNELNGMKLAKLVEEDATAYETVRERLGLQRYEFSVNVTSIDGSVTHYAFGRFCGGGMNNTVSFERLGILDGSPVIMHVEVWGK